MKVTIAISIVRNFIARGKTYLPLYKRHRGRRGHDHMVVGFTTTYAAGQWFSQCPPVSSTNKTDRHDITEILWH
jgi:hypothetical protein